MKDRLYFFLVMVCTIILPAQLFSYGKTEKQQESRSIVVYASDSFAGKYGPGQEIAKRFTEETGYTVEYVICENAGAVLSKAITEKAAPQADVLVGIDTYSAEKARHEDILEPYHSAHLDAGIYTEAVLTEDWLLTPYDWGYFTIMYDTKSSVPVPTSLEDLTKPEYARSLVMQDVRTSATGLGFAAWTKALYGNDYLDYWKRLAPSILAMSHSWSSSYGLFTAGEAALAVSYTTSMAYHIKYDKTDRYQALEFPEGHITVVEGLGVVKNAKNRKGARAFIDFMLTEKAQSVIPETNWMYPVLKDLKLPESFKTLPMPKKLLHISGTEAKSAVDPIITVLGQ
ncbi:MAG: thiamine ABC transporter substrate-binding protein [Treponema sp.]